jgi:hypothetical protein
LRASSRLGGLSLGTIISLPVDGGLTTAADPDPVAAPGPVADPDLRPAIAVAFATAFARASDCEPDPAPDADSLELPRQLHSATTPTNTILAIPVIPLEKT